MYRFPTVILSRHLHRRKLSSTTSQPLELPLSHPIYTIWGSNTAVGKTLVSAGIAASSLLSSSSPIKFHYLKPLQTGFPSDSDSRFIFNKLRHLHNRNPYNSRISISLSNRVLNVSPAASTNQVKEINGFVGEDGSDSSELICKTLYAWEEAVSPHLAAEREGFVVEDSAVLETLQRCFREVVESGVGKERSEVLCIVETAGGVASPGASGSLQCDLYRPFRIPAILVGDGRLGGISGTISAYESLMLRGYDVVAIVFEDHGLLNEGPLLSYVRNKVPVLVLPPVPKDPSNDLMEWFEGSFNVFNNLKEIMLSAYFERIKKLHEMPTKARDIIWWPFTQHKLVPDGRVTVIDSRCGENFAVFKAQKTEVIAPLFDGCASWWTQGPDAILQAELAREMGYTAARFGHVMFPENVHEPALDSAELLLQGVGKGWASRVYFSDNGSTAIEIALKMAFRKFSAEHGLIPDCHEDATNERSTELMVLALQRSYHGDTLGAMEAQAPSAYTGFLQQPWYTGRGLFLNPPSVSMYNNKWNISIPEEFQQENQKLESITFVSRDEIFHRRRDNSKLAPVYSSYISKVLSGFRGPSKIAALIMEPVIQGSGGMHMVDPLFQRILVNECRSRKIPVIFDEVFTGFWRLGVETAVDLIHCEPDIACYGKLMTGGIIPLAATLATDAVFDSFIGDSKLKALLHGHSYRTCLNPGDGQQPNLPAKGKHIPVTSTAAAATVFGHHQFPILANRSNAEKWSLCSSGLQYPCEADRRLHENFSERLDNFEFPVTAEDDDLRFYSDFLHITNSLAWFAQVRDVAANEAAFFNGSGTLADCPPFGIAANQITAGYLAPIIQVAAPTRSADPASLFPFAIKLETASRALPELAEAMAALAQTNVNIYPTHPYYNHIGAESRRGPFWNLAPVESSITDHSSYLSLREVVRGLMKPKG